MTLEDCKVGDYVRLWCIGWRCWDSEVVKIIDNFSLIRVQYKSGREADFTKSTECERINF